MNHDPRATSNADDRFIETLLNEAYEPDSVADNRRVVELMRQIHREQGAGSQPTRSLASASPRTGSYVWIRMAVAASLLIACGYGIFSMVGSNSAYAAVIRALHATPPSREYRVQMINRWPVVGEREVTATLFVNDSDEFCVQHPGWLPGGELWVGGDLESRWIVPRVGPVVTGDADLFASVLQQQGLGSQMLHLNTLLLRMSEDYELKMLDDVLIPGLHQKGQAILCQHIVGERRGDDERSPVKIELWANKETAVAERVVLNWSSHIESWLPVRWQIDLIAFPELPNDWFSYQGHSDIGRTVLPFGLQRDREKN